MAVDRSSGTLALIMGQPGTELVRPLASAGIPCGVVGRRTDATGFSRWARRVFEWDWTRPMDEHDGALAERFVRWGLEQPERPVLIYCSEEPLLFVSRYREQLSSAFEFVVPRPELVEALVDKSRFVTLADRYELPVPKSRVLDPEEDLALEDLDALEFPVVVKPRKRDLAWVAVDPTNSKAFHVESAHQLLSLWPRLRRLGASSIAQQYIGGAESRLESYHVYVDETGHVAGEFTGRKLRTTPRPFGHTSALQITDEPDVAHAGLDVVRRLDLRGVAKLDFKRAPDGRLFLLEINARFNLWHHAGACAGVNLPALVYADLTGQERPPVAAHPSPATWWHPKDLVAFRREGVPPGDWLRWAYRSEATAFWSRRDPLPLFVVALTWMRDASRRRTGLVRTHPRTRTKTPVGASPATEG
ncbi:ATP-grasp domain-containing protein [Actinomycetospora straminea]|uniref:ATP-grasp domain-containing protein n=1 Tax=Actinomycetospora straminea TaxID=663607 RepID=A0ABP9E1B7_9PSEU|nr:ATP-grasp domain-containing protein [Actinomycetospora straminea]MDD7931042.1 ATP-grasp domain-containing protein [Actinomycetospora straminea]